MPIQNSHTYSAPMKRSHFLQIPFIAHDELTKNEYILYSHLVRELWHESRTGPQSVRYMARKTRLSEKTVIKARNSLERRGYIKVNRSTPSDAVKGKPTMITLIDKWSDNHQRYCGKHENPSDHEITCCNSTTLGDGNGQRSVDNRIDNTKAAAAALETIPTDNDNVIPAALSESSHPPSESTQSADLHEHPFVRRLLAAFGVNHLTKKAVKALQIPCRVIEPGTQKKSEAGFLLDHYLQTPGFADFVNESLPGLTHSCTIENAIAFLRNFNAPDNKLRHWYTWREANKTLASHGIATNGKEVIGVGDTMDMPEDVILD